MQFMGDRGPAGEVESIPARDLEISTRPIDRRVSVRPDLKDARTFLDVRLSVSFEDHPAV
jgi:hypothetical protein